MCNQSVGLVQAAFESAGIVTVSIALLREVAERVKSPRALYVPFPMGYPLGAPDDKTLQRKVIMAALELLVRTDPLPILEDFEG